MLRCIPYACKGSVFSDSVFALEGAWEVAFPPEVKTCLHFVCDVGLPGLCDLVFSSHINSKCADGVVVELNNDGILACWCLRIHFCGGVCWRANLV